MTGVFQRDWCELNSCGTVAVAGMACERPACGFARAFAKTRIIAPRLLTVALGLTALLILLPLRGQASKVDSFLGFDADLHTDYLRVTRPVALTVDDPGYELGVGQKLDLFQQTSEHYIGLLSLGEDMSRLCAIPARIGRRTETAWVTNEKRVILGLQVETCRGKFTLRTNELLPIMEETDALYRVICERYGRQIVLALPLSTAGIVREQLPARRPRAVRGSEGTGRDGESVEAPRIATLKKTSTPPIRRRTPRKPKPKEPEVEPPVPEVDRVKSETPSGSRTAVPVQVAEKPEPTPLSPSPAVETPVISVAEPAVVAQNEPPAELPAEPPVEPVVSSNAVDTLPPRTVTGETAVAAVEPVELPEAPEASSSSTDVVDLVAAREPSVAASDDTSPLPVLVVRGEGDEVRTQMLPHVGAFVASVVSNAEHGQHPVQARPGRDDPDHGPIVAFLNGHTLMFQILLGLCIVEGILIVKMRRADARTRQVGSSVLSVATFGESVAQNTLEDALTGDHDLAGSLQKFPVEQVIQLLYSSQESGTLWISFTDGSRMHKLHFLHGQLIDAEAGNRRGKEVLQAVLSNPEGSFTFKREDMSARSRHFTTDTMSILLAAARRVDERARDKLRVSVN